MEDNKYTYAEIKKAVDDFKTAKEMSEFFKISVRHVYRYLREYDLLNYYQAGMHFKKNEKRYRTKFGTLPQWLSNHGYRYLEDEGPESNTCVF